MFLYNSAKRNGDEVQPNLLMDQTNNCSQKASNISNYCSQEQT